MLGKPLGSAVFVLADSCGNAAAIPCCQPTAIVITLPMSRRFLPERGHLTERKGIMDKRIVELALEALQERKNALDVEIAQLSAELKGGTTTPSGKRRTRTAAERRAHSHAMKLYGRRKRTASTRTKPKSGPQSAAARKAVSERMKAYWAKRKAQAPAPKKAAPATGNPQNDECCRQEGISEKMEIAWAKRKAKAAKK